MSLVNETYPSECIRFRSILSASYDRFRVDGAPNIVEKAKPDTPAPIEPEPTGSLPLKKSTREQLQNPESTQDSVAERAPTPQPAVTAADTSAMEIDESSPSRERDAFDDIIDESKAMSHLVRNRPAFQRGGNC